MSESSVYDDPSAQVGGDFIQWVKAGDSVSGVVKEVRFGTDFNGNKCPELVIEAESGDKIVTAGQVRLKAELQEARPVVGEQVTITLSQIENRPGGRTLKHFSVVKGGGAAPTTATTVDPAQAAAALAALSPEQRAALGL